MAITKQAYDVLVCNQGTLFMFCPLTPKAKQWFHDNVDSKARPWFDDIFVAEHRSALGLAQRLEVAGLVLG